jgi:hypothetical protein
MAESGCLRDLAVQNLEVSGTGSINFKSDIVNSSGVPLSTVLPKTSVLDNTSRSEFLDDFSRIHNTADLTASGRFSTGAASYTATLIDGSAGSTQSIVATGVGTSVFPSGNVGATAFVTDEDDNDGIELQATANSFNVTDNTEFYMETRFKVDDVDTCDLIVGLAAVDTDVIGAVSDGIYFLVKDSDADGTVTANVEKGGTVTESSDLVTLADDTYVTLGLYKSAGNNTVTLLVNGADSGVTLAMTNLPDGAAVFPTVAFKNGSAAVSTLTMDYLYALNR